VPPEEDLAVREMGRVVHGGSSPPSTESRLDAAAPMSSPAPLIVMLPRFTRSSGDVAVDPEQLEAERLDLSEYTEESRLVG
jgi:hypothetical protein